MIQLYELRSCRDEVGLYKRTMESETEQRAREKAMHDRELELEKQATDLMRRERDLALDKAGHYQSLYEAVKKKPGGVGCFFKRFFTFGIHRCQ